MKQSLLFTILILLFSFFSVAQTLDSLKQIQRSAKHAEQKLNAILVIIEAYKTQQPDSAIVYSDQAIQLSSELADTANWIKSLHLKSEILMKRNDLQSAENFLNEALALAQAYRENVSIGNTLVNLGNVYLTQQSFDKALDYYLKSLNYLNEVQHPEQFLKAQNNMAIIYARLKNYDKAIEHFENARKLVMDEGKLQLNILINLAGIYMEAKKLDQGLQTMLKAEKLAKKLKENTALAILYSNLSNLYIMQEDWQKSLHYSLLALSLKKSSNQPNLVITLNNIGYAYFKLNHADSAIFYYNEGLVGANPTERAQLLLNLKNAYQRQGNTEMALQLFDQYNALKDSLAAQDYDKKVAELSEKYESEKKQLTINQLSAENNLQRAHIRQQQYLIGGTILFGFLIFMASFFGFRQYQTRQTLDKTLMQQQILRAQLNPHFIFHALNSIQNFLYKHNAEKSMEYLHSFSRLIRLILEGSDQETIAIEEETEMLKNYLHLQQLNQKNQFLYEIEVDPRLLEQPFEIPSMLIQPFVENAILHGIKNREDGCVTLTFLKEGDWLRVKVSDNGEGMEGKSGKAGNSLHRSMGSTIIQERIQIFNKNHKNKIKVSTTALIDDPKFPGHIIQIFIPLLN